MPIENEQTAQIHRLITDKDLDNLLSSFQAPEASGDLLHRITEDVAETPQHSGLNPIVVSLMQAGAVLVVAPSLGIWAGMDASSDAKTNVAHAMSEAMAIGDMS